MEPKENRHFSLLVSRYFSAVVMAAMTPAQKPERLSISTVMDIKKTSP